MKRGPLRSAPLALAVAACSDTSPLRVFEPCRDGGTCGPHAECVPTRRSFACVCRTGFLGDGTTCEDVDECALGIHDCSAAARCVNEHGSFRCVCLAGYTGDGRRCEDIDECAHAPCSPHGACENTPGTYACRCHGGYEPLGGTCVDTDECAAATDPCATGCPASDERAIGSISCDGNAACSNRDGDYACVCSGGLVGTGGRVCRPPRWGALAAGGAHTCALWEDGTLWCWGDNARGQLGDGTRDARQAPTQAGVQHRWLSIAAGYQHTCGIAGDRTLHCWGRGDMGQLGDGLQSDRAVPGPVGEWRDWRLVAAGRHHTCGLHTDGALWCWGQNGSGQLGDGTRDTRTIPVPVSPGLAWGGVSTGAEHTCGLRSDGVASTLWCWGSNRHGQLGTGTGTSSIEPTQIGTDADWGRVSAGNFHTCGIRSDAGRRTLRCWGRNQAAQVGDGTLAQRSTPAPVGDAGWAEIRAGAVHTCGTKDDGALRCWGYNGFGALGPGRDPVVLQPAPVSVGLGWSDVALGGESLLNVESTFAHTCALHEDGEIWCWGSTAFGQLGAVSPGPEPRPVDSNADWLQVSAGGHHTCGIRGHSGRNTLWCWGTGLWGARGDDRRGVHEAWPQQASWREDWTRVSAGILHTCALREEADGGESLWCWGEGRSGQLGLGDTGYRLTPTVVEPGTRWTAVDAGASHSCGVHREGSLWCWGYNGYGQLGLDDPLLAALRPARAGRGGDWARVSTGAFHTCGIRQDGTLWCWGGSDYGQAGRLQAVVLERTRLPGEGWHTLEAGAAATCATTSSGGIRCWGSNRYGQLASETPYRTDIPSRIDDEDRGWSMVAQGRDTNVSEHACGLKAGALLCWGANEQGQLGRMPSDLQRSLREIEGARGPWIDVTAGTHTTERHSCGIESDGTLWCWGSSRYGQLGGGRGLQRDRIRVPHPAGHAD